MNINEIWEITPEDEAWPAGLIDLKEGMPERLWGRGTLGPDTFTKSVSIVGARAATNYGEHVARELTYDLVGRGFTIVSGGAYGIDGTAHRSAMAAGGRTVAFMAGGVDRLYPAGHNQLLSDVIERGGAVLSEVEPGFAPTKWRFLQRNRLVAAAALGSVIVEAGIRSGSLNEAAWSQDLGRPTMAVPGPVTSAASAGTARLIREHGATLVTNSDDVIETLFNL